MNNTLIVLFAAVLPAFLLVLYIWWKDKYQREPFSQIFRGFAFGCISALLAVIAETVLQLTGLFPAEPASWGQALFKAFALAAIPEESLKLLMLWLLLRHNPWFDERFDGIVYAVCVGMGFAASENIIYLFSASDWQSVAVARAMFAVPAHFLFAVTMGYFYSMLFFGDMKWYKAGLVFLVPVFLHGVYDGLLFVSSVDSVAPLVRVAVLLLFYVFCFRMLRYGRARIREHLKRDREDIRQAAFWTYTGKN